MKSDRAQKIEAALRELWAEINDPIRRNSLGAVVLSTPTLEAASDALSLPTDEPAAVTVDDDFTNELRSQLQDACRAMEEAGYHADDFGDGPNLAGCIRQLHRDRPRTAAPPPDVARLLKSIEWYEANPDALDEEATWRVLRDCRSALLASRPAGGVRLIAEERARQVAVEGWTPEHDDEHDRGELAAAAAAYALQHVDLDVTSSGEVWPFEWSAYKPRDPIRNLARAGALVAAEIDRLARLGGEKVEP